MKASFHSLAKTESFGEGQSRLGRAVGRGAAVSTMLGVPWALANTGDLDPNFGDVGRIAPIAGLEGSVRSLQLLADGGVLVAGGDAEVLCDHYYGSYYYCDYDWFGFGFVHRVMADGTIDPDFNPSLLPHTEIFDAVMQPDRKLVVVGRLIGPEDFSPEFVVYRLRANGLLDDSFGNFGIVRLPPVGFGTNTEARAVALDPANRIVVAGANNSALLVARFLPDGTIDDTFGNGGAFEDPTDELGIGIQIVAVDGGGYRVLTQSGSCQVIGLTEEGTLDAAFGTSGNVAFTSCSSMTLDAAGKLLVAGDSNFVVRLLASGVIDGSFALDPSISVFDVSAIHEADDGKIVAAGSGIDGATIVRLQANGLLDSQFGQNGRAVIDLPLEGGEIPLIGDLATDNDGAVIAVGGHEVFQQFVVDPATPFLIKLIGNSGGESPGVLGFSPDFGGTEVAEAAGEVVINVRRTGGRDGEVSVAYASTGDTATSGEDFLAVSGVLTWNDGDMAEQDVVVPITAATHPPEEYEQFRLLLNDLQGGAGLGYPSARVLIEPDGAPAGQFAVSAEGPDSEESGVARFRVFRNFYHGGAVSVTLTPSSGSATAGDDFAEAPVTLSWRDRDGQSKLVRIRILDDALEETEERFVVELSNATGGAIIGPHSNATAVIEANDQPSPPPPPPPRGGGGGSGMLSVLSLGVAKMLQSIVRRLSCSIAGLHKGRIATHTLKSPN